MAIDGSRAQYEDLKLPPAPAGVILNEVKDLGFLIFVKGALGRFLYIKRGWL
jgi:hypothetical protein